MLVVQCKILFHNIDIRILKCKTVQSGAFFFVACLFVWLFFYFNSITMSLNKWNGIGRIRPRGCEIYFAS